MPLAFGGVLPRQGKGAQIRHNQGIHPGVLELLQIPGKVGNLLIAGHGVHRHVGFHPMGVGKSHRPGQLLRGEIPRKGAHSKVGT